MTRRLSGWLVALVTCVAMVALHAYTGEFPHSSVQQVAIRQTGRLYGSTITVNSWTIGQVLYEDDAFVGRSGVMFLAVNLTLATDSAREPSSRWQVGGTSNGHTLAPREGVRPPQPGFTRTQDVVFELNPDDLAGFTLTVLDRAPIYAFDPELWIDLGITPQQAADELVRNRYATVKASEGTVEVIR